MLRTSVVAAIALFCGHSAYAKLDLTPQPVEYVAEGIKYQTLIFKDGDRQVVYEPPVQWTYRSLGADRIQLAPPKVPFAEGLIHATKLAAELPLDEPTITKFREHLLEGVPPGALDVKLVDEVQNAVTPSGNNSYEITITYEALGQTFMRSGLIANVGGTQLRFQMTAPKKDFDPLRLAFRASIMSWHVQSKSEQLAAR